MNGLTYFWCVRAACSWSTEFGFTLPGTSSISGHACFEPLSSTFVIVNCSQLMATVGNHGQSITILSKQCSSRHFIEVSSLNSISKNSPVIISMASKVSGKNCCNLNPKNMYHNKKNILHKKITNKHFTFLDMAYISKKKATGGHYGPLPILPESWSFVRWSPSS